MCAGIPPRNNPSHRLNNSPLHETQADSLPQIKTETQAARVEAEAEAAEAAAAAAAEAAAAAAREKKAEKAIAEKKKRTCASYRSNPIVQAQAVLLAAITVALGVGAYRKYKVGALDFKTVGIWGAAAVALAGADCLASQWLFKRFGWGKSAKSE
jgi:hypothetical protein